MIHWLQYGGGLCKEKNEAIQLNELKRYLRENPTAKATGYFKNSGDMLASVVRLECHQNYRDLDIDCNGGERSLRHFDRKPNNLEFSQYITNQINNPEVIVI